MRSIRYIFTAVLLLFICHLTAPVYGQLGISHDFKKPKEYEERTLRSERTDQKKFTLPKRFLQNTVTHYNYYFNANVKLNEVIEKAKLSFVDDYSQLLPFYNYELDVTAADSLQIDSIIHKSQTGIALHDLRNDWMDNLYLLWGAGYYLRKDFDSAYLMFQFINYAFAEKEKDGYYKTIGSARDGNSAYSISTKEKTSLPRKIFSEPPSRNDAFIWQIRNYLAQDEFAEAASLIVTLRNDPAFPKRLQNDLEEVQAYWFYKQNVWDSAAVHLNNALGNATNNKERARWEYLLAQLYELTGKYEEAEKYFAKAINHTTDPILDIYARLYSIRVKRDSSENFIEKNIATLLKMAKRDKYEEYRDIIYYMAAQMELERNNIDGALALLLKSTQYTNNNAAQRNKAFLQLAELSFSQKLYRQSYNFYDSLQLDDPSVKDPEGIMLRKEALGRIVLNLEILQRQDSLQRIAAMPEEERMDLVRKMVRQIRKAQGLKDESVISGGTTSLTSTPPANLFSNQETRGEWYFYNSTSRTKGANDFKVRWGNRPNSDNWRRMSAISTAVPNRDLTANTANAPLTAGEGEITFDNLYERLPLTEPALKISNDSVQLAMFELGKGYIQGIEDCMMGTASLEDLRFRFPNFQPMDEVLFNLYYCYNKNGEKAKAAGIKQLMNEKYSTSNFTTIITTGKNPEAKSSGNSAATAAYEKVYDLFIEGSFAEAVTQKQIADSLYGGSYWTPQLLYIEAVYYVKQRQDSIATSVLNNIVGQFPNTPLAEKATNLIEVLKRRDKIEEELRNLVINRPPEDTTRRSNIPVPTQTIVKPPVTDSTVTPPPVVVQQPVKIDTSTVKPPATVVTPFAFAPASPHYVVLLLNKVDPVFSNEAKNAFFRYNREAFYNKQFAIELIEIDPDNKMVLINPFKDATEAVAYIDQTKPKTATEIIPWLKGGKYGFYIIDQKNLDLLKANQNIEGYKSFLEKQMPGKF
jgi:tetratricopeptide (TPR) repeat protein